MKNYSLIFYILILTTTFSCKKEDIFNFSHTNNRTYANKKIYKSSTPVMGGCVNSLNEIVTFSLPLIKTAQLGSEILLTAKLNKITKHGDKKEIFEFYDNNFASNAYSRGSVENVLGYFPNYTRVDITNFNKDDFLLCFGGRKKLYQISNYNSNYYISELNIDKKIISITTNSLNEIFFITSPKYDSDDENSLIQPSIIYKLDSSGELFEYFKFPETITHNFTYLIGSFTELYPIDILINIVTDNNDNLFICFAKDNLIYKLDKDKNLSIYRDDIHCPTSIAFDTQNNPFVSSGPKFSKYGNNNREMTKSLEILRLSESNNDLIYSQEHTIYSEELNFNININSLNEFFLEDPQEGTVTIIY